VTLTVVVPSMARTAAISESKWGMGESVGGGGSSAAGGREMSLSVNQARQSWVRYSERSMSLAQGRGRSSKARGVVLDSSAWLPFLRRLLVVVHGSREEFSKSSSKNVRACAW